MILQLPDWSDISRVSDQTRSSWLNEMAIRQRYRDYFDGSVFKEKIPPEHQAGDSDVELYPVGLNLVKMMCIAMADSLFGEWEEEIVTFQTRQSLLGDDTDKEAIALLSGILAQSNANTALWEVDLDRNIYGGAPIQIYPKMKEGDLIRWNRVPLDTFFPIWDPEDPDELMEVYIVTAMTREQAKQKYRYDGAQTAPLIYRVEHWTKSGYETKLDGTRIDKYSGVNPWGFIPFEYIPRMRSNVWWGDSLTEDLIRVQDELNGRIADMGEAINYNAHPIKTGTNLPRTFNSDNYPIGPNELWDLGRAWKDAPEPRIDVIEIKNPIPTGAFDFMSFLYDWSMTSSSTPPIAFGIDSGGSQRSGITLEIRMWPLIKAIRRSRAYMGKGLIRAAKKTALMLQQKKLSSVPVRPLDRILAGNIVPYFASIMPRDQAKVVDEVTKRLSTNPPTISLPTAVKKLGDNAGENDRIKEMLNDDDLYQRAQMFDQGNVPGTDSSTGADTE